MKKKLALVGLLSFTTLFGCVQVKDSVEAGVESQIIGVSSDRIDSTVYKIIKHKSTGCHFLFADDDQESGLVQMMIEKDGVTIPYCEK